jgi:hypothetical protein
VGAGASAGGGTPSGSGFALAFDVTAD